jgi:hypothetical protein
LLASSSEPFCLTGIAMLLWLCLATEHSTDTLIDDAAERSGVARESLEAPALDALRRLVDLGAVVPR